MKLSKIFSEMAILSSVLTMNQMPQLRVDAAQGKSIAIDKNNDIISNGEKLLEAVLQSSFSEKKNEERRGLSSLVTATAAGPTEKIYLALGDSIPAGTKDRDPSLFGTTTPFRTENTYPQFLLNKLNDGSSNDFTVDTLINLSCPGDSSSSMLDPNLITNVSPHGSVCYGDVAPLASSSPSISKLASDHPEIFSSLSQLDAAKLVLQTHDVALITLQVGSNDFLQACPTSAFPSDPNGLRECIMQQVPILIANLYTILGTLKGVAPHVPILVSNYYAPFLALFLDGVPQDLSNIAQGLFEVTLIINAVIEHVVKSVNPLLAYVHLVNLERSFHTTDFTPSAENKSIPRNVLEICKYTFMCIEDPSNTGEYMVRFDPNPDVHLNRRGHRKVARVFVKALEDIIAMIAEQED